MAKETAEISPAGIRLSRPSSTPLYTQIYEQFRAMILSQRLRPGERLPASRNLARDLGVSRVIVSQGYEQLMMEGYLRGKTGSGTFVADVLPDKLLHAKPTDTFNPSPEDRAGKPLPLRGDKVEIIPFQGGTPSLDLFPYKTWQQVSGKIMKGLKGFHLGYDDTLGYWPLRKVVADYLRVSRAVTCEAEQVIIVTGSQQGLNLVVQSLLKRGDKVWMEDPGYSGATTAFRHAGVSICPVPVLEDGMDIDYAMETFPDARLAYITPSHQFPRGCTLSQRKRHRLLDWASEQSLWILEDDYDSEFRYEGRPLASVQGLDTNGRVIYSGTFSKVLFPGLRLAYLVLPNAEMVQQFREVKDNLDRQSPVIEQLILWKFMEEGYFLRHIRKMRLLYADRQKILIRLMKEYLSDHFKVEVSPSGMQLFCWALPSIDMDRLREEATKRGIVISFVDDVTIKHQIPPAIVLGYTAFTKYQLKRGVEVLLECAEKSKK